MKVVITDYTFPDVNIEQGLLEPHGCELIAKRCKDPQQLVSLVADADYVITQFAPLNADVVGAMERARIIVRYGIGYDNVDCQAARAKGIPVCNIPEFCIDEVADHTLAFILSATRCLRANCGHVVGGNWGLAVPIQQMRALRDQTVGLVGLGRIGRATADRIRAFGANLLAFDPGVEAAQAAQHGCRLVSLDELLTSSDIISLHCPSNDHTRGMVNQETLAKMKSGVILINVGRGDLVHLEALTAALQNGHVSAAALDVFDPEPVDPASPLLKMDNVIVSSHIASASPRAVQTLRETAAQLVIKAIQGEPLPSVVNGVT